MQKGFTFLEILVVLLIIGMLLAITSASYSQVRSRSLDQRRKTDLEEVRAALEQYRSVNSAYPTPYTTPGLAFGSEGLNDATHTYMQVLPQDPQYPRYNYHYAVADDDYTLSSQLAVPEETACQAPPGGDSCGTGIGCNYCIGSYGTK